MEFGWVLSGQAEPSSPIESVTTHHTSKEFKDDTLCKFWEVEESPTNEAALSLEERSVLDHFYSRSEGGRFVVPLPSVLMLYEVSLTSRLAVSRLNAL